MPILTNPRHERFCQAIAEGKSAKDAYVIAGYKANKGNAATLKSHQDILDRISELQADRSAAVTKATAKAVERLTDRMAVTIESLILEAEEARLLAMNIEQPSAAVTALTAKAKLAGLWVEKSERGQPGDFDNMADDELRREAQRAAVELGLSLPALNGASKGNGTAH